MKKFITVFALLLSVNALANDTKKSVDLLTCHITEPFLTYTFNSEKSVLTRNDDVMDELTVLSNNAQLKKLSDHGHDFPGDKYQVIDSKTNEVFMELELNFSGSNGMSDHVYPFEVKINNWYGGCYTSSVPIFNAHEIIEGLTP